MIFANHLAYIMVCTTKHAGADAERMGTGEPAHVFRSPMAPSPTNMFYSTHFAANSIVLLYAFLIVSSLSPISYSKLNSFLCAFTHISPLYYAFQCDISLKTQCVPWSYVPLWLWSLSASSSLEILSAIPHSEAIKDSQTFVIFDTDIGVIHGTRWISSRISQLSRGWLV